MRGSFKTHPGRKREDSQGEKPFSKGPPSHLPQGAVAAWHHIVERLPLIALYNSDEIAVEISARLLAAYWLNGDLKTQSELRLWLGKLGMTPGDRTKIPPKEPKEQTDPADKYF